MSDNKQTVLNHLKSILGNPIGHYPQLLFHCPNCNHRKNKLSINFDTEEFNCWTCAAIDGQKPTSGRSFAQLFKKLNINAPQGFIHSGQNNDSKKYQSTDKVVESIRNRLTNGFFTSVRESEPCFNHEFEKRFVSLFDLPEGGIGKLHFSYLRSRGMSFEEISKYNIGVFENDENYFGRIIIPSYNSYGLINYYIARSTLPIYNPKYLNPKSTKNFIFNEFFIDFSKPIYLVEGFFDSIKIENAIPLLGSTLDIKNNSRLIKKIVDNKTKVIISLDGDAYKKQIHIINDVFIKYGIDYEFAFNRSTNDFGSMTTTQIGEVLQSASSNKYALIKERILRR